MKALEIENTKLVSVKLASAKQSGQSISTEPKVEAEKKTAETKEIKEPLKKSEIHSLETKIQEISQDSDLKFRVSQLEKSGNLMVELLNKEGDVIQTFPSKAILSMAEMLKEMKSPTGLLLNSSQ